MHQLRKDLDGVLSQSKKIKSQLQSHKLTQSSNSSNIKCSIEELNNNMKKLHMHFQTESKELEEDRAHLIQIQEELTNKNHDLSQQVSE